MADADKFAVTTVTGVAAQQEYALGFPVLAQSHITVTVNGTPGTISAYDGTNATIGTPTIAGSETIIFTRVSPSTFATLLFQATNAAVLDADDLDTLVKSLLYYQQELADRVEELEP